MQLSFLNIFSLFFIVYGVGALVVPLAH